MDSTGNQRKRSGRMAKNIVTMVKSPSHHEIIENSAVALSPSLEEPEPPNCAPASECRRSSRKKIIKFDVRDLLNKNRKTHKIQIEARIDSNAPSSSKAAIGDVTTAVNLKSSSASREDLLSKHKTFLEKSAIFRRYSISQEQKPPPPLPIPPLLSKSNDSKDSTFCGTSSSQEFLSHALIKPKQPTSLIVAQIESNKPASVVSKRRGVHKSSEMKSTVNKSETSRIVQQKKRGRPAKIKTLNSEGKATSNITPEKAKNWKEYKACLAKQSSSSNEDTNTSNIKEQLTLPQPLQRNPKHKLIITQDSFNDSLHSDMSRSDDDGSFSGFQINKDDLSCDSPVLEKKSLEEKNIADALCNTEPNEDINFKNKTEKVKTFKAPLKTKDEIGHKEISSFSEEHQYQQIVEVSNIKKSSLEVSKTSIFNPNITTKSEDEEGHQNQKTETFGIHTVKKDLVDRRYDCGKTQNELISSETCKNITKHQVSSDKEKAYTVTSKASIVTKVEDVSINLQKIESKFKKNKCVFEAEKLSKESESSITTSCTDTLTATQNKETITDTVETNKLAFTPKIIEKSKVQNKVEGSCSFAIMEQVILPQSSATSFDTKSCSPTSSSSESENASDRSVYSSEPFSTTSSSSPRSYKSGSMVKVSIKRISLPKSPSTSSQTSTSEELNSANIEKKKPPIAKRSKRQKKKLNDSLDTYKISANIDDFSQKNSIDTEKLDLDVEKRVGLLATKLYTEKNQTESFTICSKEDNIKAVSPNTSGNSKDTFRSDESVSDINSIRTNEFSNENIHRKSLRNRKDCNSYRKKGEDVEKTKCDETQTLLAKETVEEDQLLGKKVDNPNEKCITDVPEKATVTDQSDDSEGNKQGKKFEKSRTPTKQNKKKFGKCTTLIRQGTICENKEILVMGEKTEILKENVTPDKATSFAKCVNSIGLHNEDDINMINKISVDQIQTEITKSKKMSKVEKSKCLVNEAEICTKDLTIQQGMQSNVKKDGNQKLSVQSSSEYQVYQEENADSKCFILDTQNVSNFSDDPTDELEKPYKVESSQCKPTKQEQGCKIISAQIMTQKEEVYSNPLKNIGGTTGKLEEEVCLLVPAPAEKKPCKDNENIFELIQVKTSIEASRESKCPIQNLAKTRVAKEDDSKIYAGDSIEIFKGDVLLQELKDKKEADVGPKENPSTPDQSKKSSSETTQKPFAAIVKTAETASTDIFTTKKAMEKENATFEATDESNEYEGQDHTPEILNAKNSKSSQIETKTDVLLSDGLSEKNKSIKSDIKVEIASSYVPIQMEGSPTNSGTQQDIKTGQTISLKNSANEESSKDNRNPKDDTSGKLLTVTSEVRENEVSRTASGAEENKTQINILEEGRSKFISTNINDSSNIISLPKSNATLKEVTVVAPKRTSSEKASSNESTCSTSSTEEFSSALTSKMVEDTNKCLTNVKMPLESSTVELPQVSTDPISLKIYLPSEISFEIPSVKSLIKTVLLNDSELSKHSSETTLHEKLQGRNKTSENSKKFIKSNYTSGIERESPLQDSKTLCVPGSVVSKRVGRKPRFKNLHATEDSETDSSNGKITPIDETIQQKLKPEVKVALQETNVDIEGPAKSSEIEVEKNNEFVNAAEEIVTVQEDAATNISTSQIKNVSIETNTLLDILRTVQSNTAAALKARKSPINTDDKHTVNCPSNANIEESSKNVQHFFEIQQEVTTSPIINLSPERSNSNSPLTLKKVTPSPTRSSSASPLTLKKVTRRYERRSRRGEDSHKTLEETFAEIAAQSSKAVLAAKEFEEKSPEEFDITNTSVITENEVKEKLVEFGKISTPTEMNLPVDRDIKADEVLLNVAQNMDKQPIVPNEVWNDPTENVVGAETSKTTPTRRGRKPKNRPFGLSTATKEKEIISAKSDEESREESEDKDIKVDAEITSREDNDESKHSKTINQALEISLNENLSDYKEETFSPIAIYSKDKESPALLLKGLDDMNENKPTKKFNNKSETKDAAEEDNSLVFATDDVRNAKQPIKKRDSLNKSETKLTTKKGPRKAKSEQEDTLNLSKEDISVKNSATAIPLSKRGRKPKNPQTDTSQSGSKKKTKKDSYITNDEEDTNEGKVKVLENECESSSDNLLSSDERLAKKTRQRKLKEAFEAALTDSKEEFIDNSIINISATNFDLKEYKYSATPERRQSFSKEDQSEAIRTACITPVESEEDPDPLKDIEKFIADGVNLLKKDYKLDENSVDDAMQTTPINATEIVEDSVKTPNDDVKLIFSTFETPADTPVNTPSVTPPPKSPSSLEPTTPDGNSGVRRSHRIKLITKTPKALVGRGLVRDRERFSIKDDVETKSHYTLDDHLTDLAEVEAKNAKFLKEMEERLSNFQVIKENEYLCERVISREARKMICDCFLTHEEEDRGELGCGEDCLNRLLMIECGTECNVKERCTNKRFQKLLCSPCRVFRTEKKGFGIMADIEILPGEFIMEYVGEVINTEEFEKRRVMYSQEKNRHYYFMALRSDAIIDATIKGNISRFINHSCDPNAETQKWTVNGELRIGFFSRKSIMPGEEITFNYQYQRYGREAQRCYCESSNCTGWIGQEPTSDEGEQIDDEDDESEDEEEEAVNTNLLVQDDEDDSDASVADPEEVQKRLEMAAAQAEVELAPLQLIQEKGRQAQPISDEGKTIQDLNKSDNEEDSKSKFKKLLSKMAEKVAAKQKQSKREQKLQRKKKSKKSSSELANKLRFLEDPDIEDEVQFLKECGLKNQSDTLRLSRLMVRAKLVQTRLNLLEILRKGDLPCRRLFLDYHGLRLLHGWMSEDAGNMQIRLSLLRTLQTLPIANKTVLTDSKVMQVVRTWSGPNSNLSPNEDSSSSNSNFQDVSVQSSTAFEESSEIVDLQKLALKLNTAWEGLPEIFRIPKKERIEQMKEHEREADRQYAANAEIQENTTATDRYRRDRFGRGLNISSTSASTSNRFTKPNNGNPHKAPSTAPDNVKNLSKAQRRELFAAKVARDEAEKRLAEERREFETKCRFFGLDPKKTRTQDMPFCVNPATGQWFSIERKPITTPPSYAHVQVPVKPKSTDPNDYQLPAVCSSLPPQWKYAITPQGKIYFYHIKHRLPQWEPPSPTQLQQCEQEAKEEESESEITSTAGEDSSDDDDDVLIGMDAAQLKAYINRKVEMRRQKRYQRLVDERSISPRREEDRIYNQIEVRKYKENKEKIRKRKEDIRRKRAEVLRQTCLNLCTLGSITETIPSTSKLNTQGDEELGALPIQDYLLSSDEEADIKAEVNSPLIDKIVEGDKIVDELDALTTKRQLKRPLPPHRDLSEISTSSSSSTAALIATTIAGKQGYKQEYKKRKLEKKEKRKPKEQDAKYRKNKEKFRCEIAGIIVHHLKPYLKETCTVGRIQSNEDFNHLARKLTHFVMIKELKYCESVGQTLVVTESVKSKSREFIKKYMAKYGDVYVKPTNDPDFKDIPFTL